MSTKKEILAKIAPLRDKIDAIDDELVKMFNTRAKLATEIGHIKRQYHLPVYVPAREEDVIAQVQKVNKGPLSNDAIRRLFERVIDESRRLERETTVLGDS